MPDFSTFAVVAAAALALSLTPGPAVLYIVARGVEGGTPGRARLRAGHRSGRAGPRPLRRRRPLGDSGLFRSGLQRRKVARRGLPDLARPLPTFPGRMPMPLPLRRWNADGSRACSGRALIVNVLNPKTALFFLAFLPQFVDPALGSSWLQMLLFGLTFAAAALATDSLYALLSGTASDWIRRRYESASFRRGQRYFSGGIYLALGAVAAVSGSGKER